MHSHTYTEDDNQRESIVFGKRSEVTEERSKRDGARIWPNYMIPLNKDAITKHIALYTKYMNNLKKKAIFLGRVYI